MAIILKAQIFHLPFILVSDVDHVSPLTGATPAVLLSKNGSAFSPAVGPISEIGDGWYCVALNDVDTNTVGSLAVHCSAVGADNSDSLSEVIPIGLL